MFGWLKKKKEEPEVNEADRLAVKYLRQKLGYDDEAIAQQDETNRRLERLEDTADIMLDAWRYSVSAHPTMPTLGNEHKD